MKTKLTLALMAIITSSAFAGIPKVLPEFKNAQQLAEWREEMAARHAATSASDVPSAFYTGKPYIEATGSYAFKYRSYNPELARWTSEDPSGFPDGANPNLYCPSPTHEIDFLGLYKITVQDNYSLVIENTYTLEMALGDIGISLWTVLIVSDAAYQEFKNSINMDYHIGDPVVVGSIFNSNYVYLDLMPTLLSTSDQLLSIEFKKEMTGFLNTDYLFTATINSRRRYNYE